METKNKTTNKATVGSSEAAAANDKKRKLTIYGTLVVALVFGALGVYALLSSKALTYVRTLTSGQSLTVNQALANGNPVKQEGAPYIAAMQNDGNLVVYNPYNQAIWQTRTGGSGPKNRLTLQPDGNLVLYSSDNRALWSSQTMRSPLLTASDYLTMQNDGNLVLYSSRGPVWSSFTGVIKSNLTQSINSLRIGQTLYSNQMIDSGNGPRGNLYGALMQADGNFVVYNSSVRPIWNTGSTGSGANRLVLQPDGNLVLYNPSNRAIWQTGTIARDPRFAQDSRLQLQTDGNLVLLSAPGSPIWSSFTGIIKR